MSKTSYVLIGIMVAALAYMGAVRIYQVYDRKAQQKAAESAAQTATFTFQNVPVSLAAPKPEPVNRPVEFTPAQSAIFLESGVLSEEQKTRQAQETIVSILDDYKEDPHLQKFNKDLSAATKGGASDLGALSGVELVRILKENPQVRQVVQENMQNPEFAKTVQEIFTNPQFVQSVKQLQGANAVPPAAPEAKKRNSRGKI